VSEGGDLLPYVPSFLPKFIGLSELAVAVMTLAALTHVLYADFGHMPPSLVLASLKRVRRLGTRHQGQSPHADWCSADWVLRAV